MSRPLPSYGIYLYNVKAMHAFLIVAKTKELQEKEVAKILIGKTIDPFDITRISSETTIGIAVVRELIQKASLKPYRSDEKVIIIEEAQTITPEAQNALLKTLEEPPDNTIIILLVSTNRDSLLPTVISRCKIIELTTNNVQLTTNELSALSSQLSVILEGAIGERFALAEEVAKDRETAVGWLTSMIFATRQKMLETSNKKLDTVDVGQHLNTLRLLQRTHLLLSTTNVNPRFTLETLFLSVSAT